MYKLQENEQIVLRVEDYTFIPFEPANIDYQAYLNWLAKGNEPLPADEPDPPTYEDKRRKEYGPFEDQLEYITEYGLEAWQQKVAEIKLKYPKDS